MGQIKDSHDTTYDIVGTIVRMFCIRCNGLMGYQLFNTNRSICHLFVSYIIVVSFRLYAFINHSSNIVDFLVSFHVIM